VYPRGDFEALGGVNLHCAPGTVTALVGRSGSGKSSLVSLLPRFNEPTSGCILLDGADYTSYTLPSLRRQIAWVGQSVVLFDGTLWTDDEMLRKLLVSGMKPRLIAQKMKRSIGAIQSRIYFFKKPRKRLPPKRS